MSLFPKPPAPPTDTAVSTVGPYSTPSMIAQRDKNLELVLQEMQRHITTNSIPPPPATTNPSWSRLATRQYHNNAMNALDGRLSFAGMDKKFAGRIWGVQQEGGKIYIAVVTREGKPTIVEDDAAVFPSDSLMAKLGLLP